MPGRRCGVAGIRCRKVPGLASQKAKSPLRGGLEIGLVIQMVWGNRFARVLAQLDPLVRLIHRLVFMPVGRSVCDLSGTVGLFT